MGTGTESDVCRQSGLHRTAKTEKVGHVTKCAGEVCEVVCSSTHPGSSKAGGRSMDQLLLRDSQLGPRPGEGAGRCCFPELQQTQQ